MTGTFFLILNYAAIAVFLVATIVKIIRIANSPVHFRWELYPVPHEKGKFEHGGSRLEEVDWWTKPQKKGYIKEYSEMGKEIFMLKAVWEHNKALWLGSYPFHIGLYLLIGNIFLISIVSIAQIINPVLLSSGNMFWSYYLQLISFVAWLGSIVGIIGGLRLIFLRIIDKELSSFSAPSHYFNIILISSVYLTLFCWLAIDPDFNRTIISFYTGLFTLSMKATIPVIGYFHIGITLLFIMYLPHTHMTHFFAKYFTYHHVRWEDAPNNPGGKLAGEIDKLLKQKMTWSASHIGADGKKNWVDIATQIPTREKK